MKLIIAIFFGLSLLSAHAGEMAYTVRATELKAKPFSDAETLRKLPEHTKVEVLKHQSSWLQIQSDNTSGWVKLLSLRFESNKASGSADAGGLKSLFNVATTGSSGHTVTTGVRGLSEENINNAQANPEELKRLKSYEVSSRTASGFAKEGSLREQRVNYFPGDK